MNARVPDVEESGEILEAGPLRVHVAASGDLQVGWDEPDWLGPGRLIAPDWVDGGARVLPDEPVVVLRLAARESQRGFGSGDFATPKVGWHFDPKHRSRDGAPEGLRAFGHQYTEFALPVVASARSSTATDSAAATASS